MKSVSEKELVDIKEELLRQNERWKEQYRKTDELNNKLWKLLDKYESDRAEYNWTIGVILLFIFGLLDWGQDYASYYESLSMLGKVIASGVTVIIILIIISVIVAVFFLGVFIWAVKSGQFDDTVSPAIRILFDDKKQQKSIDKESESESKE